MIPQQQNPGLMWTPGNCVDCSSPNTLLLLLLPFMSKITSLKHFSWSQLKPYHFPLRVRALRSRCHPFHTTQYHHVMFQFRPRKCKYCRAIRGTFCYSLTLTFSTAVWCCLINGDNLLQFPVTFTLGQVVGSEMKIDLWVLLTMVHIICRGRRRQRRRWRFTS